MGFILTFAIPISQENKTEARRAIPNEVWDPKIRRGRLRFGASFPQTNHSL